MAAYLVTFIYLIIVIIRYFRNKSTVGLILSWMMLAPAISIGGMKYSASYLVVVLLTLVAISRNPRIKRPPEGIRQYLVMLLVINLLFVVSWILFNRKDPRTMLAMLCGALKNIILLFVCWKMNIESFKGSLRAEISKMLQWLLVINVGAVILQMLYPDAMGKFFIQFLNDAQTNNLEFLMRSGSISRCFGLFGQATSMGVFALFSLTYILLIDMDMKTKEKLIYSVATIFCGVSAASKTFLFGSLILFCAIIIGNLLRKRLKARHILTALFLLLGVSAIYIFSEQLYEIVFNVFGGTAARPFLFIKDLGKIFVSRFDTQRGTMFTTGLIEVVKNNILFGVGAASIMGEPVFDNAVLVILHNGGIVCLCIVLSYYLKTFLRPQFDINRFIALIIILASGIGFDTWTQPFSTWLILGVVFESSNARSVTVPKGGVHLKRECRDT